MTTSPTDGSPIPPASEASSEPVPPPARRPPTGRKRAGAVLTAPLSWLPLLFLAAIVAVLLYASDFHNFGLSFWGPNWFPDPLDPASASYGVLVFAAGTVLTSALAVFLAGVLSIGLAISLVMFLPGPLARVLALFVDLLAGIPSVVYGIWGYVVLAPYFANDLEPALQSHLGFLPGLGGSSVEIAGGTGLLLAVLVLTLMVVPLTTALVRDSLRSVPRALEESGLALGATRWEVVRRVHLRYARRGIFSAVLLGLGRALGETVAVFMVIGNQVRFPPTLYSGTSTIATLLVGQFDSAFIYPDLLRALVEIALVLFLITLAVNVIGRRFLTDGGLGRIALEAGPEKAAS